MGKCGVGGFFGDSLIEHDERGGRGRLVKPINSLPDHLENVQSLSKTLPGLEGPRNRSSSCFTQPGLYQPSWVNDHLAAGGRQADLRNEDNSGVTIKTSVKKDIVNDCHSVNSVSQWDCSASASPSYHTKSFLSRFELDISQQPTWKARSKYGSHQQALRNIPMSASLLKDEAQTTSAHQSNLSGNEPSPMLRQYSSSSHSAGFGSREPLCSEMKNSYGVKFRSLQGGENLPHQQDLQHPTHDANMAAADALTTTPATGRLPRAAQLTIFYADMVNVYEDVPYDKAQAIMLLASRESHSNYLNPLGSYGASAHPGVCDCGAMSQPTLRASSPAPSTCAGRPPPADIPIAIRLTPARTIELPQARKASLARFLERRRDRVRTGSYAQRNEALRRIRDASPSPSLSTARPPTRLLSPPAAENKNGESSNASGASTTDSEANSPPPIQPSQSMSEDVNQMLRKESETSKEITQTPNELPSPTTAPSKSEAVVR